ncbi:PREDICTED: plant UBX domain-containing protein 10-like [Nicotiana attenuata]|uniref:Plant ubx domain-containing protein 10 n=1 Tax=Nicotiana attenuata TaxID=49451 RepID=A0A1J6IWB1_NICAT|nr:PREDICTED: plant UBX domain-containing protein 10-like [Nicotiana attenuata]OIT04872.1 plant ubx domain-containing protein 10 [Nicotiana attenuata]
MIRGSGRATGQSYNGIVRRMVSLPRNIMGGFSRVMDQGMDLMGIGGRRNQHQLPHPNFPYQHPYEFPFQDPFDFPTQNYPHDHLNVQEEWAFLTSFEQQYGTEHPFFYACRFMDALKIAKDEHKFLFVYLHSPQHPFTPCFCSETLCCEVVVEFLDANYVCWGELADRGEGLQMATTLKASSFPFCALVAPAPGDSIAVLQQLEGPVSPAELVEILQRTMEEQGLAFGSGRAKEQEKLRADRRLREEQDVAYIASLQIDQEKERLENIMPLRRNSKPEHAPNKSNQEKPKQHPTQSQSSKQKEATSAIATMQNPTLSQSSKKKEATFAKATMQNPALSKSSKNKESTNASAGRNAQITQIAIRFPNGERREHSFSSTDKIQAIFRYIDSLGLPGVGNYRLISNFPRKVYGVDQMGVTLKDAGLHPKASLFLELI